MTDTAFSLISRCDRHENLALASGETCVRCRKLTITAEEFIRRFLQHVLPTGFQKVPASTCGQCCLWFRRYATIWQLLELPISAKTRKRLSGRIQLGRRALRLSCVASHLRGLACASRRSSKGDPDNHASRNDPINDGHIRPFVPKRGGRRDREAWRDHESSLKNVSPFVSSSSSKSFHLVKCDSR